ILSAGGSAADAATAMYFTLAVTLPSRAGLGGGGSCLAFDAVSGSTQALDFAAQAPSTILPNADRPSAIPANPRGFFALQARHGRLQWREVVASAEQLARFGHPASRAFALDLASVGQALLVDNGARAMFGAEGGRVVSEGEMVKELDLAATLGLIRARGVGPFYSGQYANNLVNAVNRAGGSLSIEALRNYTPQWRDTVRVKVGNEVAHFAPPPAAASTQAAVMLAMLIENGSYDGNTEGGQDRLLAEVSLRAFSDRETWLNARGQATQTAQDFTAPDHIEAVMRGMRPESRTPLAALVPAPRDRHENASATAFSAVDSMGNAVSCVVSMNAAFGTGRVAPGTGILLAAAPSTDGRGPIGLAPMLVVNENSREFHFAAGASGGVAAPTALMNVAARVLLDDQGLQAAVAAPRVHLSGDPDVTYHEPGLAAGAVATLSAAGHRLATTPVIGLVNAISCPDGLPTKPGTCAMAADPRGQGLASGSMR
ncbi:MAG TPA: gamma-glutamyltransferase, partial [Magnetovibrio sp.]